MAETITEVCATCSGARTVEVPICRGGSDHAGHHCGGTVCGTAEAPCPDCTDDYEDHDGY